MAAELQIQGTIGGERGIARECQVRGAAGSELRIDLGRVLHQLRVGVHVEGGKAASRVVRTTYPRCLQVQLAGRRGGGSLYLRVGLDRPRGQQPRHECIDQFRFHLLERRAHVQDRGDPPVDFEHRLLCAELEVADGESLGKGQRRWG